MEQRWSVLEGERRYLSLLNLMGWILGTISLLTKTFLSTVLIYFTFFGGALFGIPEEKVVTEISSNTFKKEELITLARELGIEVGKPLSLERINESLKRLAVKYNSL